MKSVLKYCFYVFALLLFFCSTALLVVTGRRNYALQNCNKLEVKILGEHHFINEDDISNYMDNFYGSYIGLSLKDVDLSKIESILSTNPSIRNSEAWLSPDGILHIDVEQRTPALMISNGKGQGYYSDMEGVIFPLCRDCEADVPVIQCHLGRGLEAEWLRQALNLVNRISTREKWKSEILSYSVDNNGDFLLHGQNEVINFGDFSEIERKMGYINRYFSQIRSQGTEYTNVNVKYKGQIICRKKGM